MFLLPIAGRCCHHSPSWRLSCLAFFRLPLRSQLNGQSHGQLARLVPRWRTSSLPVSALIWKLRTCKLRHYPTHFEKGNFDRTSQCFRTAAIRYYNGSVHNLVQLEGSSEYKHLMRRLALGDTSIQTYVTIVDPSNEKSPQFAVNNRSWVKYSWPGLWKSPTAKSSGAVFLYQRSGVHHWYCP